MERRKEAERVIGKSRYLYGDGRVTLCDLYVVATASDSKIVTQINHRGEAGRHLPECRRSS